MKFALSIVSLTFICCSAFSAPLTLQDFVKQEIALAAQLSAMASPTASQVNRIRAQITDLRYQASQLAEANNQNKTRGLNEISPPAFSNGQVVTLNPAFSKLDFQDGDILVVRGSSVISATIANITDQPSPFSHSFIIYRNPADNVIYAIEAIIGEKLHAHPLNEALSEGLSRMNLYRYQDAAIASAAGAKAYLRATTEDIPYADSITPAPNFCKETCAEDVADSYLLVTQDTANPVKLPSFPSTIGGKFPNLIKALGLPAGAIISNQWPIDFETSAGITLVAESIDPAATFNFRAKDAAFLKLLGWIEDGSAGQNFSDLIALAKQQITARQAPQATNSAGSLSQTLNLLTVKANAILDTITTKIILANQAQIQKTGKNMSQGEITKYVESIRGEDFLMEALRTSFPKSTAQSCEDLFGGN